MRRLSGLFVFSGLLLAISTNASADVVTRTLDRAGAIHNAATGNFSPTTDYYGSGNDDNFGEFGVATFTFTAAEFGGSVTAINSLDYTLTHNDRTFSDGTSFELWFTTDDFDATYSSLVYDETLFNGFDTSLFTNVSSLGSFSYSPQAGGTMESFSLNLTSDQQADLIDEINLGSEFSIIITAQSADADVTFTGDDDNFEPGGQPVLAINASAVPEPTTGLPLAVLAIGMTFARRRR